MVAPPVAEFSGTPTSGTAPLQVNFTDLSVNNPTGWSWTFGDGGSSTAQNPSYSYASPGTYTVSLTASNAFGSDIETKTGYITVTQPSAWTVITFDAFEDGFGNYSDGGADCILYTGGTFAHQGSNAADIQDDSRSSYFQHSGTYNVSGYSEMEVDFWYYPVSMDNSNEGFFLQYFNGSSWQTVDSWYLNTDFLNNNFYHETVAISSSQYNFPSNARLRFMCDGSGNADDVYIDEIEWRGMSGTSSVLGLSSIEVPDKFEVHQNYPNPFNPSTEISFSLPEAAHVSVEIFNILGQRVNLLLDDYVTAGIKTVTWDSHDQSGNPVSTGIYFYRVVVDGRSPVSKKMMLIR